MRNGGYTPGRSCLGKRLPSGCRADAAHLVGCQFEVEDVVVLGNVGGIGRVGDGDGAALQMPAKQDLIGRLVVSPCNTGNHLVLRERLDARAATTEGEPGFEDGAHLGDVCFHAAALVIGMRLVLQHSGLDGGDLHHAIDVVLVEIREPDAANLSCPHAALHSLVSLFVVGCRVVEQEQVNVVESEAFQSLVHLTIGVVERRCPEFRRDENLLTLDAEVLYGATDATAHAHLVAIDVGRVDESHAHFQGVIDRLLGLGGGEVECSYADDGPVIAPLHELPPKFHILQKSQLIYMSERIIVNPALLYLKIFFPFCKTIPLRAACDSVPCRV